MKTINRIFLSLLLLPLAVWAEDYEAEDLGMAQVVTFKHNVSECLAPVQIKTIDGELRNLPSLGFEIEPGWHTMHGIASINLQHCPVKEERTRDTDHIPALEWLFEAGKKYYVGLDHSSPYRKNWRIVVWKVEDLEG
jgi:hypothetical protein